MPLLDVRNLRVDFHTEDGVVHAVRDVSFSIGHGKTLGVVGESGCGKSVTAMSVMHLVRPPGRIVGGEIHFARNDGVVDLNQLERMGPAIRAIRGNEIAMIFQEPMTSLNPAYTVGRQIMEPLRLHKNLSRSAARSKALEMVEAVGIPAPESRFDDFPHQLSGGMRQRIMIAMALSCGPSLLIADEPTTALDVTIQAQVLKLMNDLRVNLGSAIMFITHDLGVVAQMADDVVVMYLGQIVESAPVKTLFRTPKHPYTQGLMQSIPSLAMEKGERLVPIRGAVPNLLSTGKGCGFAPRCPHAMDICHAMDPPLSAVGSEQKAACWLHCPHPGISLTGGQTKTSEQKT